MNISRTVPIIVNIRDNCIHRELTKINHVRMCDIYKCRTCGKEIRKYNTSNKDLYNSVDRVVESLVDALI